MNRKYTLYLFISTVILTGSVVFASPDRSGFWNERASRLDKEGERFSREGLSPDLLKFIADEKERCNAVAEIFTKKEITPEFLTENPKIISDDQITYISRLYAISYSQVYLLRTISDSSFSGNWNRAVTESLAASASRIVSAKGINPDKKYIASFMHGIDPREIQTTAVEYAIESGINSQKNSIEADTKAIASQIRADLETRSFTATESRLNDSASHIAAKYFPKKELRIPMDNVSASTQAENSGLVRKILDQAERVSSDLVQIHEYLGIAAPNDASSLSVFVTKQNELEKSAFSKLTAKLCNTENFIRDNAAASPRIPKEPDMAALFLEIDKERQNALRRMRKEKSMDDIVADLQSRMLSLVNSRFKECADTFFREDEKRKILAGNDPEAMGTRGKSPFDLSKEILRQKLTSAHEYCKENVLFVRFCGRLANQSDDGELYGARISSLERSAGRVAALDKECANASGDARNIYAALQDHIRLFFNDLESLGALSADERSRMAHDTLDSALARKKDLSKTIAASITQTHFLHEEARSSKTATKYAGNAAPSIAQNEINSLSDSIRERIGLLKKDSSAPQNFSRYAALFNRLNDEAESGAASDELKKAIASRSLIPLVADFNPKAIEIESRERKYLIKGIESDCATISSLKEYNSRQKIILDDSLSSGETGEIAKLKKPLPGVPVAGRIMTESNIAEVDRNAALLLEKRYRRATWEKSLPARNTRSTIDSPLLKFSLSLPEGFGEKTPLFNPAEHSVVKNYSDSDGVRTILVAIVPLESKASDDTGEWIASMGKTPVGKNHTDGFAFSVTAKDSHSNVMEAYSIEKNGKLVIIAGECPRDKFPFFRDMIRSVAASADFGQ